MYEKGIGVTKDEREAIVWYRKSATQGNSNAQYNLGVLNEKGRGGAVDFAQANQWYRKASVQGDVLAIGNLSMLYLRGDGVKADKIAGLALLLLSATLDCSGTHPSAVRFKNWKFYSAMASLLLVATVAQTQPDPLPSWSDGAAKQAIVEFVQTTTTQGSPKFVPPAERIATFDQDGTLWVEQPVYSFLIYALERVPALAKAKPELKNVEPFKTVLSGNREAIAKLTPPDLEKIIAATFTGMSVADFNAEVSKWIASAKDPRWKRPYTELVYQPMQEVLKYLRANGYKTCIVTGGGQDIVRVYSQVTYGIPPEQVVGTAVATKFGYGKSGKPVLTKEPKLLLNDNDTGKPEGMHLMIGQRPHASFGNSTGDQQMLEYTKAGDGARLSMIVLHDDAKRECAYGPAQGPPATKVGTFTQKLYDEAQKQGWTVISMKNDWKKIFAFE